MFTKLNNILQEGDTAKLVVTKTKTGLSVTILPVLKEDAEVKLIPITGSGSAEELDAQLIEEFGKVLPEVRQTLIDTAGLINAAKERKAEEEKKAKDAKKAKDDKKSTPAPKVKGTKENKKEDDDDEEDDTDEETTEKPAKEKPAPEPPKPKLTALQQKTINAVEELLVRANNTKDEDMVSYLQKNAISQLKAASLEYEEYSAKFDSRINQILAPAQL